jgi:hypothetical protein
MADHAHLEAAPWPLAAIVDEYGKPSAATAFARRLALPRFFVAGL